MLCVLDSTPAVSEQQGEAYIEKTRSPKWKDSLV